MRSFAVALLLYLAVGSGAAFAQEAPAAESTDTQPPQLLDKAKLDQLVAPIALYPDALLVQVLMASTYPLEIVQAERWAAANKSLKGEKLDAALAKQDWDDSVKALVATPTVLSMMNDELDWTTSLGDAVLAQQADLMDAIQRLRSMAQENGKLATTEQQTVTVTQEAEKQVIVIESASPDVVYVPYYEPAVVYGTWPYPSYPPYYYPPAPGWVVGGALVSGIAWGAGFAIGNAIWDDYDRFDWDRGDINVDIDKNVDIDIDRNKWEHNSYHRRGVNYKNKEVRNKFAKTDIKSGDRKLDFRGHDGKPVLKPDNRPEAKPGDLGGKGPDLGDKKPDLGGIKDKKPELGDKKPDLGGMKDKKPELGDKKPDLRGMKDKKPDIAALDGKKSDLGKAAKKAPSRGNAFDLSDGPKAKDYSKRGQASVGNRSSHDFAKPKGGGAKPKGGGAKISKGGGGRSGGGRGGGGGRKR